MAAINLDVNMIALQRRLNLSTQRMIDYTDKTVDEIIQAEAAEGNTKALEFARQLEKDPDLLIKTYNLDSATAKYNIMSAVPDRNRSEFLELLEDDDLRMGLNFYTQEELLTLMVAFAPMEEIVNAALICFPLEKILEMMPEKALNAFILNEDLDPDFLMTHLSMMPPEVLAAMLEAATGMPEFEEEPQALMEKLRGLDPDTYREALIAMHPDAKRLMAYNMQKEVPEVMQLFPPEAYALMMNSLDKEDMMPCTQAFQKETLMAMNNELPPELMSIVLAQIDPEVLAKELVKNYPKLLNQIIEG